MPDHFKQLCQAREDKARLRALLGQCIHALNLAANAAERRGEDASIYREAAAAAQKERF